MKIWRNCILIVSMLVLVISAITVSAGTVTDASGDILHVEYTRAGWSGQAYTGSKPNVDIVSISGDVSGNTLTVTFKVAGSIEDSDKIVYTVFYNTTDAYYLMSYQNGTGVAMGMPIGGLNFSMGNGTATAEDTITWTINLIGESTQVELWGFAAEYIEYLVKP